MLMKQDEHSSFPSIVCLPFRLTNSLDRHTYGLRLGHRLATCATTCDTVTHTHTRIDLHMCATVHMCPNRPRSRLSTPRLCSLFLSTEGASACVASVLILSQHSPVIARIRSSGSIVMLTLQSAWSQLLLQSLVVDRSLLSFTHILLLVPLVLRPSFLHPFAPSFLPFISWQRMCLSSRLPDPFLSSNPFELAFHFHYACCPSPPSIHCPSCSGSR